MWVDKDHWLTVETQIDMHDGCVQVAAPRRHIAQWSPSVVLPLLTRAVAAQKQYLATSWRTHRVYSRRLAECCS